MLITVQSAYDSLVSHKHVTRIRVVTDSGDYEIIDRDGRIEIVALEGCVAVEPMAANVIRLATT